MDIEVEAERVVALFEDVPYELLRFFSEQLSVLRTQAVNLLGLCGLAVTVTGFSGAHMIRSGSLASGLLVFGMAMILVAAVLALHALTQVRWVTQDLADDLRVTAVSIIQRRNLQQHRLARAGHFVAVGLAGYLGAVSVAALA